MKSPFTLLVTAMTVLVMTLVLSISSANGFLGHSQASIVMLLGVFFLPLGIISYSRKLDKKNQFSDSIADLES